MNESEYIGQQTNVICNKISETL